MNHHYLPSTDQPARAELRRRIAEAFGVHHKTVSNALKGKT